MNNGSGWRKDVVNPQRLEFVAAGVCQTPSTALRHPSSPPTTAINWLRHWSLKTVSSADRFVVVVCLFVCLFSLVLNSQ